MRGVLMVFVFWLCALALAAPENIGSTDGANSVFLEDSSLGEGPIHLQCLMIAL